MPLDPIVSDMLQQMEELGGPALNEMSPDEGRAMYLAMNAETSKQELPQVSDAAADGIPIRIYRPELDLVLPCLVYFHGGGWVIGDLETHDAPCRLLAKQANCVVIAVDYRRAPEHPFPAALDDCYSALQWVQSKSDSLLINASKIAVGGDSAGGNLAACVCLKARDDSGPGIVHQLLVYPATDASMKTKSYVENGDGYMLTRDSMIWFWNHYVGEDHRDNPLASPSKAEDLSRLPSATVLTAEFDPLRDEGEVYADRLKAAGVSTFLKRYDGLIHGFISFTDALPAARDSVKLISDKLQQAFNG